MRRRFAIIAVLLVASAAMAGMIYSKRQDVPPTFVIEGTAQDSVKMGELHPSSALWVFDSEHQMYLVVLRGQRFVSPSGMYAGGVGNVVEIAIDATTHHVLQRFPGEETTMKDLQSVGTPHSFLGAVQKAMMRYK